jgi:uncharacterized protein (DUF3820 family)
MQAKLTGNDRLSFGKFKGWRLATIPPSYFLFMLKKGTAYGKLKEYIIENEYKFKQQVERNRINSELLRNAGKQKASEFHLRNDVYLTTDETKSLRRNSLNPNRR